MKLKILAPRLSFKEQMFFSEHLAVMLKAGIALDRALSTLSEQTRRKAAKTIFTSIAENVREGKPLSDGLKKYAHTFSALFINMVTAGEYSGKLEESLRRLHVQMKKDYDLRSKVIGALTYPAFVVVAMIGIGTAMMIYVIPRLTPVFAGFGTQLPIATRMLIAISNFMSKYTLWVAFGFIVISVAFFKLIRGPLRRAWHTVLLHLPLLGTLFRNVNIARFSRTFSTLLGTDILVVEALTITSDVLGNSLFKNSLKSCAEKIKGGTSIGTALQDFKNLFPPTVHTMVLVGEESGNLKELLEEVANFYEEQVDAITKNISSIIEPLLIVLLGVAIGGIAIAILMPMYSIMNQI